MRFASRSSAPGLPESADALALAQLATACARQRRTLAIVCADARIKGLLTLECGRDAGLRDGNWDYAITADLADEQAYRRYDEDDEHNRLRRENFGPVSEQIVRVQYVVD